MVRPFFLGLLFLCPCQVWAQMVGHFGPNDLPPIHATLWPASGSATNVFQFHLNGMTDQTFVTAHGTVSTNKFGQFDNWVFSDASVGNSKESLRYYAQPNCWLHASSAGNSLERDQQAVRDRMVLLPMEEGHKLQVKNAIQQKDVGGFFWTYQNAPSKKKLRAALLSRGQYSWQVNKSQFSIGLLYQDGVASNLVRRVVSPQGSDEIFLLFNSDFAKKFPRAPVLLGCTRVLRPNIRDEYLMEHGSVYAVRLHSKSFNAGVLPGMRQPDIEKLDLKNAKASDDRGIWLVRNVRTFLSQYPDP